MSAGKQESFEKALERLERIAARLEAGDVPLEKGVALYKEGMGLVADCRKRLEAAKLELSLAGEDGALKPFDVEDARLADADGEDGEELA
ncbi:Exonuclease VII small subunit [Solidesulfovibrio fructosivorans JJ]]|uniref:Exodeoxyribonuclease 7 small subunit n=1 Tax=Solidesulfovibrio fructosivorans JJ] TaxID=596151 RepID=E1JWQ0_SOLFR|nr:exodeoxyribonuclease VII small subunit [Solidesulfovibrio fructosivorans]EFL51347.1 Exonuclease VII small subunit [Solidesulfovibrio fructosivorans JJ]]